MPSLTVTFHRTCTTAVPFVWVGFAPDTRDGAFSIANNKTGKDIRPVNIALCCYPFSGNWYTLEDLSQGIAISRFCGRIYMAYGQPWRVRYELYEPRQNTKDANLLLQYDKMEISYTGESASGENFTGIDHCKARMKLYTYFKGAPVNILPGLAIGEYEQDERLAPHDPLALQRMSLDPSTVDTLVISIQSGNTNNCSFSSQNTRSSGFART